MATFDQLLLCCIEKVYQGNKENNVFKDALGVKGLGFKHHGNHPGNHGSHYGNHHGNYHDNHSNHHGNYHAKQLLFCMSMPKSVCICVIMSLWGSRIIIQGDSWLCTAI